MKVRKLIKNDITQKEDIVFFGSHGYNKKKETECLILNNFEDNKYYKKIYLNLDFNEREIIKINCEDNNIQYYFKIYFNIFLKENINKTIEFNGDGIGEYIVLKEDLLNEYSDYITISNFTLILWTTVETSSKFTIQYVTKQSKLIYDKKENYTYLDSQLFSYSVNLESVQNALIPRLSIIKGELWYKASYGLPLIDKITSKGIYDSIIVKYITDYKDVINLEEFTSTLNNHIYTFNCIINTIYNEKINFSINNKLY